MRIARWLVPAICMVAGTACRKPTEAVKSALEDAGYQLEQSGWMRAAGQDDVAALRKFLDAGFDLQARDDAGDSALHAAAAAGAMKSAAWLLDRKLAVDLRGAAGRTPLMSAVLGGHGEMVRWLLRQGADPQAKDDEGFTPLMLAVRAGTSGPVRELAPYQRENLDSALLLAALVGQAAVIDALTNYGASVYARLDDGRTPLMIAAENGHAAAVELLLDLGASRFSTDAEGRNAADLATAAGHEKIAALITGEPDSQLLALESPQEIAVSLASVMETATATSTAIDAESQAAEPTASATGARAGPIQGAVLSPATVSAATSASAAAAPVTSESSVEGAVFAMPAMVMRHYRERELPVEVRSVVGETATLALRGATTRTVQVSVGGKIPGSRIAIVRVQRRMESSKLNLGQPQEVAVLEVRDETSGVDREWKSGVLASAHDPVALVEDAATGLLYTAMPGQRFKSADGAEFIVADVRPNQLVIEDAATGAVQTIPLRGPKG